MADATRSSYARARRVLDAGLEAMGGLARLRAADRVTIKYRAVGHPPGQNASFDAPPITVPRVGARTLIDYSGGRYVTDGRSDFPSGGYQFDFRQVVTPRRSFSIDVLRNRRGNTVQNIPPPQASAIKLGLLLEAPHLLLLYADDRAPTLRWLGESRSRARTFNVVAFAAEDGTQVSLYFDARTNLPARYETLGTHPLLGDVVSGGDYSGYRPIGGVLVPGRRANDFDSRHTGASEYAEVALDFADGGGGLLEVPAGYVETPPLAGEAAEPLRKLGDGVYLLQRLGYRVMFVEFADHVMVLETPTDANTSQLAINRIKQTAPGKPIRYVSFSHFHFDHTGGLRQYVAEGAIIVVPPGNRAFVERVARSRFTVRPDALARRPLAPKIETFAPVRVFTDGERTVELYSIGPTAHAADMVLFYFPKEKILFQGDMFSQLEAGGVPPVIEINRELVRKVEALGLRVETLIGVHAGAVPWQTFRDAVGRLPQ